MVALSEDGLLSLTDLPSAYEQGSAGEPAPAVPAAEAEPALARPPSEDDVALSRLLDTVAAARTMTEAASLLGVTRSTLYRQLARHGIKSERVLRQKV
jgi:excisionase family DNA binding protein